MTHICFHITLSLGRVMGMYGVHALATDVSHKGSSGRGHIGAAYQYEKGSHMHTGMGAL